jgi:hypothetical protein
MMSIIISIGSILLLTLVGIYFYYFDKLKELLKSKYKEDYEAMGKPTLVMNSSISNNLSFHKYLSAKKYVKHNDDELNTACKTVYVILKVAHILIGVVILLFVLDALQIIK